MRCYHGTPCVTSPSGGTILSCLRTFASGDRDFRRFWLSAFVNNFGGQISVLALPLCAVTIGPLGALAAGALAEAFSVRTGMAASAPGLCC